MTREQLSFIISEQAFTLNCRKVFHHYCKWLCSPVLSLAKELHGCRIGRITAQMKAAYALDCGDAAVCNGSSHKSYGFTTGKLFGRQA